MFKVAQIRISATKAIKFDRISGSKQHNITFTSFSINQLEKPAFYLHARPSGARMRHRQKAYGPWIYSRNTIFKLAQIRISATKALKFDGISGSKQHNINFHVFRLHSCKKPAFYLHARPSGARMRHQQKANGPWIPEIQCLRWPKFVSLLQSP